MSTRTITYTRTRFGKVETVTRSKNAHGESRTPLHRMWKSMRERCHNPHAQNYRWYGERGIAVCEEWRRDYLTFAEWARSNGYEPGLQLDRIDNERGYSPDNCRFVTRLHNLQNQRQYLPPEIEQRLVALAEERDVPVYLLIREAIERLLKDEGR